ncbi:hypothetical protein RK851_10080 [Streptococcus pneumoniae]|uniref:hypothetical protein n=1 Tax=Streptococcus pneumoniae TaxID=1313 RepID=UPI0003D3976D|nr:hypothetical protein [Streptococcus pneumoniae]ETE02840.1 hypothetical protein U756_02625 [Streptococcus pneumoniae 27]KDE93642.1 hypothetical protein DB40_03870 [Streptococcus pneumoniae]KXW50065.1 hypothetical protein NTPn48_02670 [Streptococcus pneumoniae]KXW54485.1 hypothetical protein NTPn49_06310 [Streptococcus pneumoniae]MDD0783866.1 hypothetical protein [Streptococcus pneumoniae]
MKTSKTLWYSLLFVALVLFLLGLNSGQYLYNFLAIIISFIVYKYGYSDLFREYDEKQRAKRETSEKIYHALREGKKKEENK